MKLKTGVLTTVLAITVIGALTVGAIGANNLFQISQEESEANLKAGIQANLISEKEKEMDEKIKKEMYENNEKVVKSDVKLAPQTPIELSAEKKVELDKWTKKGQTHVGVFKRKVQQISGKIPSGAKRVSLAEAKEIIENNDFETALKKLEEINITPDFEGGSGLSLVEYWLDDNGTERILAVKEEKTIFYKKMVDDLNAEKVEILKK
ncbi:hypothetical protein EHE19_001685 [Ruminiclostridium herbifermentans]|uniref:Uncharacterized protein n=1 Tax=Ruminiclostridium herbifermentans TaxID=2488810 RepID=A0A4U7J6Z6_9FIRM|nr:hypothetical protein [Ruminiclostridium herbifermentans]QNU67283.1 hypothetical protein EHE19_001685 [Ruminiclostridium herbifermentans]